MKERIFALVDCNNFYVSCERVFNPMLNGKPVIVLSNNDGCAVSRSNEAKELGIPMGAPAFKYAETIAKHKVHVYSSNYVLYGDMSQRVMDTLKEFSPNIEIYSIDEAFIELTHLHCKNLYALGKKIREKVLKCTGIPISIGIARTKTLAKIANKIGKKNPQYNGVLSLVDHPNQDYFLEMHKVGDVWGVGRKYNFYLQTRNIHTTKDLKYANRNMIKQKMTVQGERTVLELNEIPCIPLEEVSDSKQQIVCSRSFGRYVETLEEMNEAVATYVTTAARKLRQQKSTFKYLQVFILTNYFNKNHKQHSDSIIIKIHDHTSYTPELIYYALEGLRRIYKTGYKYKKAGVIFMGVEPESSRQYDFFVAENELIQKKKDRLMATMDNINEEWGRNTIKSASMGKGYKSKWGMNQMLVSKRYTTCWHELLQVRA